MQGYTCLLNECIFINAILTRALSFFLFFCYVEMNLYFLWKQISSEWRCWVSTFPCLCGNGFPWSMEAAWHEQPPIGNSLPIYREKSVQTFCFLRGMWCCSKWQNNLRFSEGNQKISIHGTKQLKSIKSTFFLVLWLNQIHLKCWVRPFVRLLKHRVSTKSLNSWPLLDASE